jgi:hypothetical protein
LNHDDHRSVYKVSGVEGGPPCAAGEETDVSGETVYRDGPWWADVLLRGPSAIASAPARVIVTLMLACGAVCTLGSGVIHLYLWGKQYGYRDIPTIGPLFLLQGIAAILLGLLVLATRRVLVLVLAGGMLDVSVVALVVAVEVGMFGFKDSWLAPYAWTTLYEEIVGAVLLLSAAGAIAWSGTAGRSGGFELGR